MHLNRQGPIRLKRVRKRGRGHRGHFIVPVVDCLWGKTDPQGRTLGLLQHLNDTAAVAFSILERERLGWTHLFPGGVEQKRLALGLSLFAGLHDIGKATPVFQTKRRDWADVGRSAGLLWDDNLATLDMPHGLFSQVLVESVLLQLRFPESPSRSVSVAVAGHHGYPAPPSELRKARRYIRILQSQGWMDVWTHILQSLEESVGVRAVEFIDAFADNPGTAMFLAGLTSVSDWIASDQQLFPVDRTSDREECLRMSATALDAIGWRGRATSEQRSSSFKELFGFDPRPLQSAMESVLSGLDSPSLIIVEAPMGEGKTEAALQACLKLEGSLGHRGLYFALPTRATGRAMYDRVSDFCRKWLDADAPDVHLVVGGPRMQQIPEPVVSGDGVTDKPGMVPSASSGEWFSPRKRALLSGLGVGTVDQALLGVLNVRHQFVRLWGLANRTLVLDEVHAYDTYTTDLIERLLEWMSALGSSVILMSATLPAMKRERLIRAYGGQDAGATSYPRITHVSRKSSRAVGFDSARSTKVAIESGPEEPEPLARHVLNLVRPGGAVCYIANTVARAQEVYSYLKRILAGEDKPSLRLFHARFPEEKRSEIEKRVLAEFGPGSSRDSRGSILVATQVVEQSLDVDFDVMMSDLAPVDLLLQRAGRLWRHEARHPTRPYDCARLYVSGLGSPGDLPELLPHKYIYEEHLLLKTAAVMKSRKELSLPEDLEGLVEAVYTPEAPAAPSALLERIAETEIAYSRSRQRQDEEAANRTVSSPGMYSESLSLYRLFDPEDEPIAHESIAALTRLGSPSIRVIPVYEGSREASTTQNENGARERISSEMAIQMLRHAMNISKRDLVRALVTTGVPARWQLSPLLRNFYPLWLNERGEGSIAGIGYRLDPMLGLVYTNGAMNDE